jgi:hypothetical protein
MFWKACVYGKNFVRELYKKVPLAFWKPDSEKPASLGRWISFAGPAANHCNRVPA